MRYSPHFINKGVPSPNLVANDAAKAGIAGQENPGVGLRVREPSGLKERSRFIGHTLDSVRR